MSQRVKLLAQLRAGATLMAAVQELAEAATELAQHVDVYSRAAREFVSASREEVLSPGTSSVLPARDAILTGYGTIVSLAERKLQELHGKVALASKQFEEIAREDVTSDAPASQTSRPAEKVQAETAPPRRADDWDDLPVYTGGEPSSRSDCLHCGAALSPGQKRFCSGYCREFHVNAYGPAMFPRRKKRRK